MNICVYIYIYRERERERERQSVSDSLVPSDSVCHIIRLYAARICCAYDIILMSMRLCIPYMKCVYSALYVLDIAKVRHICGVAA